jgi:HEAT repeat protein
MALYYACLGVFGGTSQLLAGVIVEASSGLDGQFFFFILDAYTLLFALAIVLALMSLLFLRRVRTDSKVTVEEFAGLFLHGNPFQAMTSLIGYHFAKDESALVTVTERLGQTRSPLTVEELLQLLSDPRFNIRFEAIISIARTRPHPRLTQALIDVFNGTELALSNVAAWALGRSGDPQAIPALRLGLDSNFHSVRVSSARALGRLHDTSIIPLLRERLPHETDKGLQMAYASALGNLAAREATPELLTLLATMQNEGARRELALSLARLVGEEGRFILLMREAHSDLGTVTARTVTAFKRRISKSSEIDPHLLMILEEAAAALARDQFATGAAQLTQAIALLPAETYEAHHLLILQECAKHLEPAPTKPAEAYLLLLLHTLEVGGNTKK